MAHESNGTTRPALISSHDEITADWLTQVMSSKGDDVVVESFVRRPVGEGVGMMALIELVDLTYSKGSGPATVVVKLATTNEANRGVAATFDIYRREALFYRDVADVTAAATPAVYFADAEDSMSFVIVLEDLGEYRLGDQLIGCGLEDAEVSVVEVAKLHASFWGDVDRPEFDFVPYEVPSRHGDALLEGAKVGWDPMVEAFGDVVPEFMQDVRERFLAAARSMQEWLVTTPITLSHGDYRLDNLFFGQAPDHEPIMIIDWQGFLRSKGVRDIAYLVSQSMPIEDRRAHERHLVERWHSTLVEFGVTDYSAEQAWEDYRRAVLAMWIVVVVIAGTLDSTNERGKAWMTEMIRRSAATIEDLDLLALLPEFE